MLEKARGPDDPELSVVLSNLSDTYINQKRYDLAEPLLKRSLRLAEKLGPDNASVAQALNNLAAVYLYQDRHDDAEPLLKRSVTVFEKSLGPTNPELVESLDNLAALYKEQGPLRRRRTDRQARGRHPRQGDGSEDLSPSSRMRAGSQRVVVERSETRHPSAQLVRAELICLSRRSSKSDSSRQSPKGGLSRRSSKSDLSRR